MQIGKVITAEDRRMRLPWWGVLCVMLGALPVYLLFDHFGKSAFARPTLFSVATIAITNAMRWKLRRRVWFWMTMVAFAALHVPLILFVPWTTKWIPALAIAPVLIADSYAMLWAISLIGTLVGGSRTAREG